MKDSTERDAAKEKSSELEKQLLLCSQDKERLSSMEKQNAQQLKQINELAEKKTKLENELSTLKQMSNNKWESEFKWKEDSIKAAYEDRCTSLVKEKEQLIARSSKERQDIQEKLSSLEATNGRLELQLQMMKEEQRDQTALVEKDLLVAQSSLAEAKEEIKRLRAKLANSNLAGASQADALRQKQTELENLKGLVETNNIVNHQNETTIYEAEIQALKSKLGALESQYCQQLKDAVVETSNRVGLEWSSNCKSQLQSLREYLQESDQALSKERMRNSLRESELMARLEDKKAQFAEQIQLQREESAKLYELNQGLLRILNAQKAQASSSILARQSVPPVAEINKQDEAELAKLSMQLNHLRNQCQQLNKPFMGQRRQTTSYDFSPVKPNVESTQVSIYVEK